MVYINREVDSMDAITDFVERQIDAAAPTCLYDSKSRHRELCNCGDRWTCDTCRKSWKNRNVRSSIKKLETQAEGSSQWFGMLTLPSPRIADMQTNTGMLWDLWSKLGKRRSDNRYRGGAMSKKGVCLIRRGLAALHIVNKRGELFPHLHAVLVCEPNVDAKDIQDLWKKLGGGYADLNPVEKNLAAVVNYSIGGELPESVEDRKILSRWFSGKKLVRTIGGKKKEP